MVNECCACTNVKYIPEEYEDGLFRERWVCVSCWREFVPKKNVENLHRLLADSDWMRVQLKRIAAIAIEWKDYTVKGSGDGARR
jgi:hypothetical protein